MNGVSEVQMSCCRCGVLDVDFDVLRTWGETQDISCECGGQLSMVALCVGGPLERTVRTVGEVGEALDQLLVVPGFTQGGVH